MRDKKGSSVSVHEPPLSSPIPSASNSIHSAISSISNHSAKSGSKHSRYTHYIHFFLKKNIIVMIIALKSDLFVEEFSL